MLPRVTDLAALGLRRNPFGEPPPEDKARLAVVDVPRERLARVRAGGFALLLTGPPGRGKTTHLLALAAGLPGAPLVRVPLDGPPPALPDAPLLLVDELHLLPARARAALLARRPGLIATTHADHADELARAGLPWAAHAAGGLTPRAVVDRLAAIVERRLLWSRRSDPGGSGPGLVVPRGTLEALVARHGDDLRAILDVLYERVQAMTGPGEVRP